jgi:hypothetical protein
MALSPPATVAAQILSDIEALSVSPGTPVSNGQLLAIWTAVVTRIYADLKANAQVAPGSFVVPSGPSAGPISGDGGPLL